jgi:hypothetical protein
MIRLCLLVQEQTNEIELTSEINISVGNFFDKSAKTIL